MGTNSFVVLDQLRIEKKLFDTAYAFKSIM